MSPPATTLLRGSPSSPGRSGRGPVRQSAPYGLACVSCARAKCRCVLLLPHVSGAGSGSGSDSGAARRCERCARLNRECRPSAGVRRKQPQTTAAAVGKSRKHQQQQQQAPVAASRAAGARDGGGGGGGGGPWAVGGAGRGGGGGGRTTTTRTTRTARLEEKLEDLVSILRSQATTSGSSAAGSGGGGGVGVGGNGGGDSREVLNPVVGEAQRGEGVEGEHGEEERGEEDGAADPDSGGRGYYATGGGGGDHDHDHHGRGRGRGSSVHAASSSAAATAPPPQQQQHDASSEYPWLKMASLLTPASSTTGSGLQTPGGPSSLAGPGPQQRIAVPPLTPAEAEEMLALFRDSYLVLFPFIYLPRETTAAMLQRERPFLWLNIWALCCKSPAQQVTLRQQCREVLARRVLVDMERDLDLLQGLLVYLAWIMHHFCGRPFLVAGLNLALTLVNDLRLDRPPHEPHPSREPSCFKPYAYPKVALSVERSNDQRRAVLALYILSLDSSMFIRNQSMRWTPHMEDSLHRLGAQPEHAGDDLLVLQVRTQRIIEDVASMTWRTPPTPGEDTPKTPMAMCVRALRYNLRQVRDTSPQSLAGNKTAQLCLAATDMLISDMPFYHRRASSGPGSSAHPTTAGGAPGVPQPPPPPPMIDPARTAAYHGTLEHSAVCLEVFTSSTTAVSFFPSSSSSSSSSSSASTRPNPNPEPEPEPEPESLWVVGLPFPALVRFFRATQILYRLALTTGDEDGGAWDRAALRERVDPIAHIAAAARCYEASAASGSGSAAAHTAAAATGGMSPCRDDDDNDYYMDGAEDGLLSFHARCVNAFRATIPVWQAVLEQAGGGGGGGSGGAGADDHDTGGIGFADGGVVGGDGDGCGGGGAALFPPSDPPLPLGGPPAVGFHEMWPVDFAPDEAWWNDMMNSWDAL